MYEGIIQLEKKKENGKQKYRRYDNNRLILQLIIIMVGTRFRENKKEKNKQTNSASKVREEAFVYNQVEYYVLRYDKKNFVCLQKNSIRTR